jgi:hypothetical protein
MTRYHGRDAIRFGIGLSNEKPRLPGTPEESKVPEGVSKYVYPIIPTPSDKDRWRDKAVPRKASGSLVVDADVGVVLKASLTGTLSMPLPMLADKKSESISLSVSARLEADGFGNPPSIPPPGEKEIAEIPRRIQVDTHPIDFYFGEGFTSSLGPPAGVAARPAKEDEKPEKATGGQASKP